MIAASVWMKSSNGVVRMSRLSPLTMPELTEPPSPSGLPIAITLSPTRTWSLSPSLSVGSRSAGFTLQQRDVGPAETANAGRGQGGVVLQGDGDPQAFSTTCRLVTMIPPASMMKPEPKPCTTGGGGWRFCDGSAAGPGRRG